MNTASTVNRTRSVRNGAGTPLSARAAARKPADDDDAKAELLARLDELQERLQQSDLAYEESQKHGQVLQIKLDEALKEQTILEDSVHEHGERVEELENEKKESLRARRELEQIYEAERVQAMNEKEAVVAREEEMQGAMQRIKETLTQREMRDRHPGMLEDDRRLSMSRTSSFRSANASPNPETAAERQFAPPSSLQRSDSRSSSRLVMQKDKIIEGLRLELAEAQIKLVELENKGGGSLQLLERDMYDIKMQNARLMEENESFQLLLGEKTLNGDFAQSDLLRAPSSTQDSRPPSLAPLQGASLADELDGKDEGELESAGGDTTDRRLQAEVNGLKDQNKALTLYINNIISRLLQHEQFEQILDKTPDLMAGPGAASMKYAAVQARARAADTEKDLPPPPPSKDAEEGQQSLLQRAGSVLRGRAAGKPPRPASQMIQPAPEPRVDEPTVHENPSTAPRIPLARSTSTRGNSGHRRANSEWPAASVVTNMYKGPSPGLSGPTSPGLSSPTGARNSFFALGASGRVASGNSVPTISESFDLSKENQNPAQQMQRDSKVPSEPRSNRNSVQSNPGGANGAPFDRLPVPFDPSDSGTGEVTSNPSSPPRSTTSSGEREGVRAPGGAIMMGSKPRPLRLVQDASDEKARKAGNRGSWFGWMIKGGMPAGAGGFGGYMAQRSVSGGEQGGQGQGQ